MMTAENGHPLLPIWLVGDSNPVNWEKRLKSPLDARHPARHSIWTPIWDAMQEEVYLQGGRRIDSRRIYIRNAVESAALKPAGRKSEWPEKLQEKVGQLGGIITKHAPRLILSLGSFSFEFCRRALGEIEPQPFKYWGTERMGNEFFRRMASDPGGQTLLLPLLHASIARRHFIASHDAFCGKKGENYFHHVGKRMGEWLLVHGDHLGVWLSPEGTKQMERGKRDKGSENELDRRV